MLTYVIIALDGGSMVHITEEDVEEVWTNSIMPQNVREAIEAVLEHKSEKEEEKDKKTCWNTGLPCLKSCTQKTCAGADVPLKDWPR